MTRRRAAAVAVCPVDAAHCAPSPRAKLLGARAILTVQEPGGEARRVETELPAAALGIVEACAAGDGPTIDDLASAAQELAQLRLLSTRALPELGPALSRLEVLLRRLPGVEAELGRRRAGRG